MDDLNEQIADRLEEVAQVREAQGKTRDWVVLYVDGSGVERRYTVLTAQRGAMEGQRVVAGRESECTRSVSAPQLRAHVT